MMAVHGPVGSSVRQNAHRLACGSSRLCATCDEFAYLSLCVHRTIFSVMRTIRMDWSVSSSLTGAAPDSIELRRCVPAKNR